MHKLIYMNEVKLGVKLRTLIILTIDSAVLSIAHV